MRRPFVEATREWLHRLYVQRIGATVLERWRHAAAARLAPFDVGH
jgi:hypothetical protein